MSSSQQQVSDIYLKRENLKEAEANLQEAKEKLRGVEADLTEAKKYFKYLIVSLLFLGPSPWVQGSKRTFLIFMGFAFLVHVILMDIGIDQVITVLFKNEWDKRQAEVEKKTETVEEKRQKLYGALSNLKGKNAGVEKAIKENILTSREEIWKKLKQIREEKNRENISHTGWVDDKLLQDIVLTMPLNKREFIQLPGSNRNTYDNFGKEFLTEIQEYYFSEQKESPAESEEHPLQAEVSTLLLGKYIDILEMYQAGASLLEITNKCKTNEKELLELINTEVIDLEIEDLVPQRIYQEIKTVLEEVGTSDFVALRERVSEEINSNYINLMLAYERQTKQMNPELEKSRREVAGQRKTIIDLDEVESGSPANAEAQKLEKESDSKEEETDNQSPKPSEELAAEKELISQIITEFESYYEEHEAAVQINQPQFKENYFVNIDCDKQELSRILTDSPLVYKVDDKCFALNSWILLGLAKTVFASWERAKFIVIEIKVRDILGVNQVNKSDLLELLAESDHFQLKNNNRFVKFVSTIETLKTSLQDTYQPFKKRTQTLAKISEVDEESKAENEGQKEEEKENTEEESKKVQLDPQSL